MHDLTEWLARVATALIDARASEAAAFAQGDLHSAAEYAEHSETLTALAWFLIAHNLAARSTRA